MAKPSGSVTAVVPPCPYLRRSFALPGPLRRATLHCTALGVADLFLNGEKIGSESLKPGWPDFRQRVQVMTLDVTKMLQAGEHRELIGWKPVPLLFQRTAV